MPTFKVVVLPHQKRNDGTYNVKIRVTQNRVSRFIRTVHYVSSTDISKRKDNGKERIKIKNQAIIDLMDELMENPQRVAPVRQMPLPLRKKLV